MSSQIRLPNVLRNKIYIKDKAQGLDYTLSVVSLTPNKDPISTSFRLMFFMRSLTRANLHLIQEIHNSFRLFILTPSKPLHPMRIRLFRQHLSRGIHIAQRDDSSLHLCRRSEWTLGCGLASGWGGLGARCGRRRDWLFFDWFLAFCRIYFSRTNTTLFSSTNVAGAWGIRLL